MGSVARAKPDELRPVVWAAIKKGDEIWVKATVTRDPMSHESGRVPIMIRAADQGQLVCFVGVGDITLHKHFDPHVFVAGDKAMARGSIPVQVLHVDGLMAWCKETGSGQNQAYQIRELTYAP
jgi:hypothetical protein